jgi:hypothetical protein
VGRHVAGAPPRSGRARDGSQRRRDECRPDGR